MGKLKRLAIRLRSSLWFLPAVMVVCLTILALVAVEAHPGFVKRWPRLFDADPEGSRAMLAGVATAMMTVAGVVFSVTVVALAQASSLYSPRVLRNFMRDRANQVVLGSFVGIFAYCLIVLRNITGDYDQHVFPALAVFIGFVLAMIGVGLLVFFIHHIATSIQASSIIYSITEETLYVIQNMFPHEAGDDPGREQVSANKSEALLNEKGWVPVAAQMFGYVQDVEKDALFDIACKYDLSLRMEIGVGEFAITGQPLVSVCGASEISEELSARINRCYGVDAHRTIDQDPGFGIRQLVDVAVKALSPGINDTTTAVSVVDYLSQIIGVLAQKRLEVRHGFSGGNLRIIARGMTFKDFLEVTFEQIIENARGNKAVISHLLMSLERTKNAASDDCRRKLLMNFVDAVAELVPTIESTYARDQVLRQLADVRRGAN